MQLAGQRRCEIETKPIHVHLDDPIAQAVHDQLQHARMGHVERVAAAGIIHVVAPVVLDQTIIGSIVDAAEAKCRAQLVAFAGMVVDDVEDHLDPFAVQRSDHALEFRHLLPHGPLLE